MSDSLEKSKIARYLDSHVNGSVVVRKNRAIRVHQEVVLSDKRIQCWQTSPIGRRKHDYLTRCPALDHGSLAVWALRNQGTGRGFLGNSKPRGKHHSMTTTYNCCGGEIVHEAFEN